jgi:hypothetical protein
LFGLLDRDEVKSPALNYVGITIAIIGLVVYLRVESKPNDSVKSKHEHDVEEDLLGPHDRLDHQVEIREKREISVESTGLYAPVTTGRESVFGSNWSPTQKRLIGISMAVVAGALFGTSFNPAQYVIDHKYDGEDDNLDYVFPHFCGIFTASWFYTIIYFCVKKIENKEPFVNPECILPATLSGLMWGIANISFFVANGELGFSVSFPIISSGPGFLGALWGIFLFKEIQGKKNFLTLGLAFLISISALLMIALAH